VKLWKPEQIESFRKGYKLTRKALGEMTGVTVSSIYQWERGLKAPSKTTKILLSRIEEDFLRKGE
jgi:DNA-binding transcriptional regulator YiaG